MIVLHTHPKFHTISETQRRQIMNGAGARGQWYSALIPDSLFGLDCMPAWNRHDYAYFAGMTEEDRENADIDMLKNLLILINAARASQFGRLLAPFRRLSAMLYYERVYRQGKAAFWADKL